MEEMKSGVGFSRRDFLKSAFLAGAGWLLNSCSASGSQSQERTISLAPSSQRLYVGTYTNGNAEGVYLYRLDPARGALSQVGKSPAGANPSFLALHPNGRYAYAVNELAEFQGKPGGAVSALAMDSETGSLSLLNQRPSGGTYPCHLAIDRTGRWLFVANYGSGTLAVYPIESSGRLGAATDVIQHHGSGLDPMRQDGPHAHAVNVSPDNRFLLACDLGIDKVLVYRMDLENGKLISHAETGFPPGSGPRHLDFHPNGTSVYVISELKTTLTAFQFDSEAGGLNELQILSTLPEDYSGEQSGAEVLVHPSGKFVYCSNRGQSNSLTLFAADESTGRLTFVGTTSTHGRTPRNFAIDPNGRFLMAANQDSGTLASFTINPQTGDLGFLETANVPSPVCLKFAPA
jgi:6-phosphogluconolactonase